MNQQFTLLKKAIEVFHSYGITLIGQHKNADFIQQLRMDPVFINGLIFELEYQLQVIFQEEKLGAVHTPKDLITLLFNIPQDN
ncbi:acyl carrier protein [Algoriphagus ratkowskyi]|uniref:Acyl carrier protein n=1 Tax=Algoriphagus ratkowskyi TaxID=57028 RepID=A0A2W7R3Y3_9BACT|nr:acyl carrier protein [Algoriphagus ratkowskyi]PZX53916.1 acyl carrier protein [Algoriphagus ratkowskyi]TXD76683.1 acyl carrier protein [Algoriphagus ratkowskyi]